MSVSCQHRRKCQREGRHQDGAKEKEISPKLQQAHAGAVAQRARWQPPTERTGTAAGKDEPASGHRRAAGSALRGIRLTPAKPTRLPEILPHHRCPLKPGGD